MESPPPTAGGTPARPALPLPPLGPLRSMKTLAPRCPDDAAPTDPTELPPPSPGALATLAPRPACEPEPIVPGSSESLDFATQPPFSVNALSGNEVTRGCEEGGSSLSEFEKCLTPTTTTKSAAAPTTAYTQDRSIGFAILYPQWCCAVAGLSTPIAEIAARHDACHPPPSSVGVLTRHRLQTSLSGLLTTAGPADTG